MGSEAVAFDPTVDLALAGATLQVQPRVAADGQTVVLDVQSVFSEWDEPGPPVNAGKVAAPVSVKTGAIETSGYAGRINMVAQQLCTTVRVPVGKMVIIGGMTLEPTNKNPKARQLLVKVNVTE